jgi:hypothetical protein
MASVYVDESAGSDITGVGSQQAPYQSLAHALFAQGQSATVLVRKDPTAEYEEPTQSALKKAKKGADGLEKKRKKAEELVQAATVEREKRERLLEESKKIQLVEDATLPAAVKVRSSSGGYPRMEEFLVDAFAGKDSEPHTVARKACPRPWLGTSLTLAKRHHIHRPSRRNWIFASRTLWHTRAYIPIALSPSLGAFHS